MMSADPTPTGVPWWVSLAGSGGRMKDHQHKAENAHLCDRCNRELAYSNEILSERMDLWISASNLLKDRVFEGDGNQPTPDNILDLAIFLAGENNG